MNELNVLYLHGLFGYAKNGKTNWLNHKVNLIAPQMDYLMEANLFDTLSTIITDKSINVIIAHSLGGHFGYHLAIKHNLPMLLFNPAVREASVLQPLPIEYNWEGHIPAEVVIGCQDDVIHPQLSKSYIQKLPVYFEIHTEQNMGHYITEEVFKRYTNDFLETVSISLENIAKKQA